MVMAAAVVVGVVRRMVMQPQRDMAVVCVVLHRMVVVRRLMVVVVVRQMDVVMRRLMVVMPRWLIVVMRARHVVVGLAAVVGMRAMVSVPASQAEHRVAVHRSAVMRWSGRHVVMPRRVHEVGRRSAAVRRRVGRRPVRHRVFVEGGRRRRQVRMCRRRSVHPGLMVDHRGAVVTDVAHLLVSRGQPTAEEQPGLRQSLTELFGTGPGLLAEAEQGGTLRGAQVEVAEGRLGIAADASGELGVRRHPGDQLVELDAGHRSPWSASRGRTTRVGGALSGSLAGAGRARHPSMCLLRRQRLVAVPGLEPGTYRV